MDIPPPLRYAMKEAQKSTYEHQVGAVLAKGRKIISRGYNTFRGHRWSDKYPWPHTCHAETSALLKAPKIPHNSAIHVARVNRRGEPRLARPCPACMAVLRECGVRKVVYTTHNGYAEEFIN